MKITKDKRILIVEVNWLGDVLFSTPAIRVLREKHPDSYIGILVHKRCKDVLIGNPNLNDIIVLDEAGLHRGLRGKLRLIRQLKEKQFDTVYLFHRSFTRALICYLSGIKHRIGYYTAKRKFLLTENVQPLQKVVHRAVHYYYLVDRSVPDDMKKLRCDFFVADTDTAFIEELFIKEEIDTTKKIVVIHPAGNWLPKRWPKENFAGLADKIMEEFNAVVIFSGAPVERDIVADILYLMKNKAVNLCGQTSLKQLGALFNEADLVISADSGPLHIAVALHRPTLAIFGPTSVAITGPLTEDNIAILQKDVDCFIPCYKHDCPDNHCMKQISVDDVINRIEEKKWLAR